MPSSKSPAMNAGVITRRSKRLARRECRCGREPETAAARLRSAPRSPLRREAAPIGGSRAARFVPSDIGAGIIAGHLFFLRRHGMDAGERARIYSAFADASRRLASAMDAKAGFVFAVNGALLTFLWIGARMADVVSPLTQWLAITASFLAMLALLAALWVVVPRPAIDPSRYSSGGARPISHYSYVATRYAASDFAQFERDVGAFDDADFAREALEAHFVVSRIVQAKSKWVAVAGVLTVAGMMLAGAALLSKLLDG
jgi:hypothetical protein